MWGGEGILDEWKAICRKGRSLSSAPRTTRGPCFGVRIWTTFSSKWMEGGAPPNDMSAYGCFLVLE